MSAEDKIDLPEVREDKIPSDGEEKEEDNEGKVDRPTEERPKEDDPQEDSEEDKDEGKTSGKARRVGTTVAPNTHLTVQQPHKRKISFADQKEQRPGEEAVLATELCDIDEASIPLPVSEKDQEQDAKDKLNFLNRQMRFSTASRFSLGSRPSFTGLGMVSRPSMASIKSTLTKVNSELYPERGSFVATSLGQSLAEMPQIAEKLYIITQVLAAISVSIGSMALGFTSGYTGTALASFGPKNSTENATASMSPDGMNQTQQPLTLSEGSWTESVTKSELSWVVSLMPLSAMAGSIMGGYLLDALGRKMLILVCGPPFLAGWLIIGSAYNIWMLYTGRVLCGICVGLLSLSLPVYLGETIQPAIRGTLGLFPTTFGNFGILLCFAVGSYVSWYWLAYIGAVIPLVFFCMMIFVPETPRWYVSKGNLENAERSLQWLRGSYNDIEFELEAIEENYARSVEEDSSLKDLLNRRYLKPFGLSIGLMIFQQLSGINAVISYTTDIFSMAGSSLDERICTIVVGVVNLLSTFIANVLIDKLGRKMLLYISDISMIISLIILGTYFHLKENEDYKELVDSIGWLPLASFIIYVLAFSLGWGPIPWLFMGEALPAKVRAPAASVVTAFNWICSFFITKTFPDLVAAMGPDGVFFMYGGVMVVGMVFAITLIPETKGKSLEEIEAELAGDKNNPLRQRRISQMSGIYIK